MGELTIEDLQKADLDDVKIALTFALDDEELGAWLETQPQVEAVRREGKKEGKREGQKQTLIHNIMQTLTIRFGETPPPEWADRLATLELPALQPLFEQALTTNGLAEFEPALPPLT